MERCTKIKSEETDVLKAKREASGGDEALVFVQLREKLNCVLLLLQRRIS